MGIILKFKKKSTVDSSRKVQLNFDKKLNRQSSQFLKFVLLITQLIRKIEKNFIYKILLEYCALYYISKSADFLSFL